MGNKIEVLMFVFFGKPKTSHVETAKFPRLSNDEEDDEEDDEETEAEAAYRIAITKLFRRNS